MPLFPHGRRFRAALALPAVALSGLALAGATSAAVAHDSGHGRSERLVVRGTDTVKDGPDCPAGVCTLELTDGAFRGTIGSGAYDGRVQLRVAEAFPNGEGGVCAPIRGDVTLGAGTPNRLVITVDGDSCQDGEGDVTAASFTGLARFTVKYGTGAFKGADGRGIATFVEDASDREQMTLIGRIRR